ncbi:NUDIX hydrolase [Rhizosphaericola mali]|uniref:NUDIX domain-containing protein n=1 Tax=Rhizosphaericola mali TaxID=2545455 RepID=A0A5P2FZT7_9BACT|nr:NUDIX domain-containing protein [Rhizosphaericola mali]QES89046.1 NUDIX domain-containing protein [Rhizosphaericola mali]
MKILPTVALISVKEGKLLLAFSKNKNAWYLPGGKLDEGETPEDGLIREIKEELNFDLDKSQLRYFGHISAWAYGEAKDIRMEQECFEYDLSMEIQPSHEILDAKYFSKEEYLLQSAQVEGVLIAFEMLNEK